MMGDTLPESMIDELRQTMLRAAPAAVAAVQAKRWQPPGPDFRLPPGSVAVVGADDKLLPPRNGAALLDAWDVPLRLIPGAGHIPFVERPGEFDRALKDWLTAISTKA
jgi:pimeloyl-ACP methyl ester carboxylesterase